jgi:hypothetical protein
MNRKMIGFGALALATAIGCSSKPPLTDDFSDLAGADEKSDKLRAKFDIVGSLDYGQTSDSIAYKNPPKYRAFKFGGNKGDQVTIDVKSKDGDAVAFLLDNDYNILAQNDDASSDTLDSHLAATLPGNKNPDIVTYYIAFRDYDSQAAHFKVTLKGKKAANDFYSCQRDNDCVAIDQGGCCPHGVKVAVNTSSVAAYNDSVKCTQNPHPICPLFLVYDNRVAECNTGTHKCEMVKIEDISCGGFTINPHACPEKYDCEGSRLAVDVPGKCVPAGTTTCVETQLCLQGSHWDSTQCKCVVDAPNPSDSCNGCAAGTYCSYCWGHWACIPNGALC